MSALPEVDSNIVTVTVAATTGGPAVVVTATPTFRVNATTGFGSILVPIRNTTAVAQTVQAQCTLTITATGVVIHGGTGPNTIGPNVNNPGFGIDLSFYKGRGAFTGTVWLADNANPPNVISTVYPISGTL